MWRQYLLWSFSNQICLDVTLFPIYQDDVDEYMKRADSTESAEVALRNLEESHSKYKFMEYNLTTKKARYGD